MLIEHMPALVHPHENGTSITIILNVADAMKYSPTWDYIVFVRIMFDVVDHMPTRWRCRGSVEMNRETRGMRLRGR